MFGRPEEDFAVEVLLAKFAHGLIARSCHCVRYRAASASETAGLIAVRRKGRQCFR